MKESHLGTGELNTRNFSNQLILCCLLLALGLCSAPVTGQAPSFSYFPFNYTGIKGGWSQVVGVNNNGDILGIHYNSSGYTDAEFILQNGQFNQLLKKTHGGVVGINDNDQVVGYSVAPYAFLFGPKYTAIKYPGGDVTGTWANGINANGDIVGWYYTNTAIHGFICPAPCPNGGFLPVDYPGSTQTTLYGINNAGQIVGSYQLNHIVNRDYSFSCYNPCTDGNFTSFVYPGANSTVATSINNNGQIAGFYDNHVFLRDTAGALYNVDPPNVDFGFVWALNDAEQMIGDYNYKGAGYAFVATPLCADDRDPLTAEYSQYAVNLFPVCGQYANKYSQNAHSQYFSFAEIDTPCPSQRNPEFAWALVRQPLVAPASSGYGLDAWRVAYGGSRIINSGYRDPVQNRLCKGAGQSPHMYGHAADFQNESRTQAEWDTMYSAAGVAHADYREPLNGPCGLGCVHADWRKHKGSYVP